MGGASSILTSGAVALAGSAALAAIVNAFFTRGHRRAEEAKLLSDISHSVVDQVVAENEVLHKEMVVVKTALIVLTEIIDDILGHGAGTLGAERAQELREANRAAKLAAYTGLRSQPLSDRLRRRLD